MSSEYIRMKDFMGEKDLQVLANQITDDLKMKRIKFVKKDGLFYAEFDNAPTVWVDTNREYEFQVCNLVRHLRMHWFWLREGMKDKKMKEKDLPKILPKLLVMDIDSAVYTAYYLYYVEHLKSINHYRSATSLQRLINFRVLPGLENKYTDTKEFLQASLKGPYLFTEFMN